MLMMKLIVCLALLQGDLTPRVLQSHPLKEISSRDLEGRYGGEVFLLYL